MSAAPFDSAVPFDAAAVAEAAKSRAEDGTEAELARAAALDPITYDLERAAVAERLGVRVGTLDAERARRRGDTDRPEGQGRPLALPTPEPWPAPVDGAALLDALSAEIARYAIMPAGSAECVALWVVHAHALDAFGISPRLAITSPEKGCGKTTLLDVLSKLVPRPLATANVGAAVVFRVIEAARPTLLIDEADTFLGDAEDLRGILNSGHRRGGAALRCVGDDHEPRQFGTFAACAIAMIGRLPPTLEDRAIAVEMRRALAHETPARFRHDRTPDIDLLARRIARWAADHIARLSDADPLMPEALHNRAADNWYPLLAIADAAGGAWPERARALALAAAGARGDDGSMRTRLLADIRDAFVGTGEDRLASATLCALLAAREDAPWAEWRAGKPITPNALAQLLAPFKIAPRTIRLAGAPDLKQPAAWASCATPKGYTSADFADAFGRYLAPAS